VSKIWQYGIELRALDSPKLDKYWLCHQCLPTTQIYKIISSVSNSNTGTAISHLKKDHKIAYNEEELSRRQHNRGIGVFESVVEQWFHPEALD
jgi:hypothetical protein